MELKRTVVIGFGKQEKYGLSRDDPQIVYIDRESDSLKETPLVEIIRIAQRMRPERIVCEDILRGF